MSAPIVDTTTGEMPLYQLLPALSDQEWDDLRDDIKANGIRVPIDVDEHGNVLDGHHRALIADDLGVVCPRRVVADLSEDEKRAHAVAVNLHRRNLTRDQRQELVVRLRAEGMSLRAIASATGVDPATVHRDLAGVADATPEITGVDGKRYPSKQAKFDCQVCGAGLTHEAWHCDRCGDHWPTGETCATCADHTAQVDTETGEVLPPPTPTTKPRNAFASDLAEANAAARNAPSHVAGKAIERFRQAADTVDEAGGIEAIVADLITDPLGVTLAELWLEDLDRATAVADAWRQSIRATVRGQLRSVQ